MRYSLRFWAVDGDDMNADGGSIEVGSDGLVRCSPQLVFALDLRAPADLWTSGSPSTRPPGGFEHLASESGAEVFRPVGDYDAEGWLTALRQHFRTPYLRPDAVESSDS